jgi:hypothetical protein
MLRGWRLHVNCLALQESLSCFDKVTFLLPALEDSLTMLDNGVIKHPAHWRLHVNCLALEESLSCFDKVTFLLPALEDSLTMLDNGVIKHPTHWKPPIQHIQYTHIPINIYV